MPGPPSSGPGGAAAAAAGRRADDAGAGSPRPSMPPHAGRAAATQLSRVIRRNMKLRHMTDDHHGRTAGRATLLVRAADEILGTHTPASSRCTELDPPPRRPLPAAGRAA